MKMYVLVRNDLKTDAYKAVQACHAVAELAKQPDKVAAWNNTIILMKVKNQNQILATRQQL